jgi:hypothetical protein
MIEKKHPLRQLPLATVWPWLKYCPCCKNKFKKSFHASIKKALRKKMNIELAGTEKLLEE